MKLPAKKLWKRFTPEQKRIWRSFYEDFVDEWGISGSKLSRAEKDTIAHNHALMAVWAVGAAERDKA